MKLTEEQSNIVQTTESMVEVRAYAGTGKTTVLCLRAQELLDRGAEPGEVLALTFSRAAQKELARRLPPGVAAQTLHSFAYQLVRGRLGAAAPKLLQSKAEDQLVRSALRAEVREQREALKREQVASKGRVGRSASGARSCGRSGAKRHAASLQRMKEAMDSPGDVTFVAGFLALVSARRGGAKRLVSEKGSRFNQLSPHLWLLKGVHARLKVLKRAQNVITYGDMITEGLKALGARRDHPIRHVLVDEYQDCTPAQALLIRGLTMKARSVMVFGDRMQAIFGFAGAKYEELGSLLEGARPYPLTLSFRLTKANAALATAIIRQRQSMAPQLVGARGRGRRPQLIHCPKGSHQSELVVNLVEKLKRNGVKARDLAILARTKSQLYDVEAALLARGHETRALYKVRRSRRLLDVLKLLGRLEKLDGRDQINRRLDELLDRARQGRSVTAAKLGTLRRCLKVALDSQSLETRFKACADTILSLHGGVRAFGADARDELDRWAPMCRQFERAAQLCAHIEEQARESRVRTCTIHGAKGKEWSHVVILNVVDGNMPFFRVATKAGRREERNLFYVATTRAKVQQYLVEAPYVNARARATFDARSKYLQDAQTLACVSIRRV